VQRGRRPTIAFIIACFAAALVPTNHADAVGAKIGECPLFPDDNPWQRSVAGDPVDERSNAYIASIAADEPNIHPDFGSNPNYGIPYEVVPADQKPLKVKFTQYADESDPGPYPIPKDAGIEAGGDHHVLVAQNGSCKLYELFGAVRPKRKRKGWRADNGAVFDLRSNALRPEGWTSADAAGLPILPGLVRRDEVDAGAILHALRFTVERSQRAYVEPARHFASSSTDPNLPPMGLRLRLKASFDISGFTGASKVILQALKTYGMFNADNGTAGYVSGATDTGWNDDDLSQLKTVPITAFEAIRTGTLHT
jgi:hypothetical protein